MSGARVVITGAGPVSAVGAGFDAFAGAIGAGSGALGRSTLFVAGENGGALAAEIRGFDVQPYLRGARTYLDRSSEFALGAAALAVRAAGLDLSRVDLARAGLSLGSAYASLGSMSLYLEDLFAKGPRFVKPIIFPHTYANTAISLVAMELGLRGCHINFASGRVSSALAILEAFDHIRAGHADVMLAGGYEALSDALFEAARLEGILAPEGRPCLPFDIRRAGTTLGEGAGVLVLESLEHARARGAQVLAELAGCATASGPRLDRADAPPDAVARACAEALNAAGEAEAPSVILAAANGAPHEDMCELRGLASACGGRRAKPAVTALAPLLGETLGAAAALHAIAAVGILHSGRLPPVAGVTDPLPCTALELVTASERRCDPSSALVSSLDAGGAAAALLLRAWRETP